MAVIPETRLFPIENINGVIQTLQHVHDPPLALRIIEESHRFLSTFFKQVVVLKGINLNLFIFETLGVIFILLVVSEFIGVLLSQTKDLFRNV